MGMSRRGFLAHSVGAMAAVGLPLWYSREILAFDEEQASKVRKVGPNDKIAFGLVGCGGMGKGDVGRFINRREQDCQLVALCDVDAKHLEEAASDFRERAQKSGTKEIAKHKDFRELLRPQGHRRRHHRHAGPLAHAGRHRRPCKAARTSTARSR